MKISGLYINFETKKIALTIDVIEGKEIYEIGNKSYFKIAEYKYYSDNYKIDLTQEKYQDVYSIYVYCVSEAMKYRFFRSGKNIFFQVITKEMMGRIMPIVEKQYKKLRDLVLNRDFFYYYFGKDYKEYVDLNTKKILSKENFLDKFILKEVK